MTFEEFKNAIKQNIREFLPERYSDADITIQTVNKANGVKLSGLTIRTKDNNVTPTIYLEKMYEDMIEQDKDISEVYLKIAQLREGADVKGELPIDFTKYEDIKDRIYPRLIGKATWNADMMIMRPYMRLQDMLITYAIDVREMEDESGKASVPITMKMMEMWGITEYELYSTALDNLNDVTRNINTTYPVLKTMREILIEMAGHELPDEMFPEEGAEMYVLTNCSRIYGASVILNKDIMDMIYSRIGDCIFIPSSVHEWILIKKRDDMKAEDIEELIKTVNAQSVDKTDQLSDHPYIFEDGEFKSYE